MTKIYHLALVADWQTAVNTNAIYFPPTYDADGFVHGTSHAEKLLEVANHFYVESVGDWVCLEMTEASLAARNIKVKYEPAANVGDQDGTLEGEPVLFPHIFGGLHPDVVTNTYPVIRDTSGRFLAIDQIS